MDLLLDATNLGKRWCAAYGISNRRYEAFLRRPKTVGGREPDSFYSRTSETVLTLFALGRADRWLQAREAVDWKQFPRPDGTSWNKGFFSAIHNRTIAVPAESTPLRRFLADILSIELEDFTNAVLLFELKANANYALSTTTDAIDVQEITFCRQCNDGTKFDAVLALPRVKRIISIESKLTAQQGKQQIIRGLEAAFFLTKVRQSMFEGWDYSYLFLHPPYKQYDNDYEFISDPNRAIAKYGDELTSGSKEANSNFSEGTLWQEFLSNAPSRIYERAWPDVLQTMEQDGWNEAEYHRRLAESQFPFPEELVMASKNRLKLARGKNDLDQFLEGMTQ